MIGRMLLLGAAMSLLLLQVKSARLRPKYTNVVGLPSDKVQADSRSCGDLLDAKVMDLDDDDAVGSGRTTDDDWCSSDKENDVFPFHHTASVVAMERIFAKQRLPNFVRPKGYISPLRYPALLRSAPVPSHVSVSVALFAQYCFGNSSVLTFFFVPHSRVASRTVFLRDSHSG